MNLLANGKPLIILQSNINPPSFSLLRPVLTYISVYVQQSGILIIQKDLELSAISGDGVLAFAGGNLTCSDFSMAHGIFLRFLHCFINTVLQHLMFSSNFALLSHKYYSPLLAEDEHHCAIPVQHVFGMSIFFFNFALYHYIFIINLSLQITTDGSSTTFFVNAPETNIWSMLGTLPNASGISLGNNNMYFNGM